MANLAALRAAVFSLSAKNLRGRADNRPPAVRGLMLKFCSLTNRKLILAISGADSPIFVPQLRSAVPSYADMPKQFCQMVNLKRQKVY